jgi:hypothetical protein
VRNIILLIVFALLPMSATRADSLHLSLDQILASNLGSTFALTESVQTDGRSRHAATSAEAPVVFEAVGPRRDIEEASLQVIFPDEAGKSLMVSSALVIRFVMNVFPDWQEAPQWLIGALMHTKENGGSEKIERDGRVAIVIRDAGSQLVTVRVRLASPL